MLATTNRILVPLDFSEQSLRAFHAAISLAKEKDYEVVTISVAEEDSFWEKLWGKYKNLNEIKIKLIEKVESFKESYDSGSIRIETMVSEGVVHEEIIHAANMVNPELMIMGTNGKPESFMQNIIGSNALRVAKSVKCPIITINRQDPILPVKRIIFPLELDKKSKEKVAPCLHFARIFNAEVLAIASFDDDDESKKLLPHLLQVENFILEHDVACRAELVRKGSLNSANVILEYADRHEGDMVILSQDGDELGIRIWGTLMEDIMYKSKLPVLYVTPAPAKYGGFTNF